VKPFELCQRLSGGLASRWRNVYYRLRGVRLRGYVWLRAVEIPRNHADIELDCGVSLDRGVTLLCVGPSGKTPKIVIGGGTYINRNTVLDAAASLVIGRQCAIGPGCYLTDHDHGFAPDAPPLSLPLVSEPTRLEDRVWLGANVVVLKGVTIGTGSVIGAGSVVTRDVPPGCVAVGNPARVIRTLGGTGPVPEPRSIPTCSPS
jgi:carbonic anhydrase/acetyltransferase-like protein (isoleucine patch superfamily)